MLCKLTGIGVPMDSLMRAEGSTAGHSSVFREVNGHHPDITQPENTDLDGIVVASVVLPEADGHHPVEPQVQVIIILLNSKDYFRLSESLLASLGETSRTCSTGYVRWQNLPSNLKDGWSSSTVTLYHPHRDGRPETARLEEKESSTT